MQIFACRTSRAVHLELTRTQTAKEFQWKLNAFRTRKTRPERIISDIQDNGNLDEKDS